MRYAGAVRQKISSMIEKSKDESQIEQNEESLALITFLQHIHHSYVSFEQYFKLLEIKYLSGRLKQYLDKEDSSNIVNS